MCPKVLQPLDRNVFRGLLRQTRETLPAGENAGFSSRNEGLADFYFPSLTSLSQTSTSLPVCQEVLFCCFFFVVTKLPRPPAAPRGPSERRAGPIFLCLHESSRTVAYLISCCVWLDYLSVGTVWFVECASTLSLLNVNFVIFFFSINDKSDASVARNRSEIATVTKCKLMKCNFETSWRFLIACGRVYCFF